MRPLPFALLACVFSLAIIMSAPGAGGKTDDMKLIQGTWLVDPDTYAEVKDEKDRKEALEASKSVRIIFDGESCIMKHPPGNEEKVFFRLDSAKQPKQIDFGEGAKGIYELEGDTLKLCWDKEAKTNGRPTKFSLRQEKDSVNYFILKREKKK